MAEAGTIWRMTVAGLAVWRLSRLLFEDGVEGRGIEGWGWNGASRLLRMRPQNFLGNRVMDCLYWLHVWLSAQTAMWVACGFAGVFVSWAAGSILSRAMAGRESRRRRAPEAARVQADEREGRGRQEAAAPGLREPGLQEAVR